MGKEGLFAYQLQRSLQDVFHAHEEVVLGLHKNNRRLLSEVQKLKAGIEELKSQLAQLYRQNQLLDSDKKVLEAARWRRGKND